MERLINLLKDKNSEKVWVSLNTLVLFLIVTGLIAKEFGGFLVILNVAYTFVKYKFVYNSKK